MSQSITPAELQAKIKAKADIAILDLRRQADFEATPEMIPGARKEDPARIEEWAASMPQGRETVIYCARGGAISRAAAETLQDKGVPVRFVEGGYAAWQELAK
jgi:rhodanese-related sulfurtransferase